ncbi:Phosphopentomutase [Frankliniella fusca]|uniref:Phosphopentomutase n=1 Tax=Frankliniella fusca TaxID=407009 RepID=A0AAE1HE81_9NEOP|nr:Phosphopentomutase [Frankliniella fusca]
MAKQGNKVNYELYDISSGGVYDIRVDPSEVQASNNDKEKRYRIINNFKSAGRKPDRMWESLVEENFRQPNQRRVPSKKKVVSVGDWNDAAQWALLCELVPFRRQLRTVRYACKIWEEVSQKLKTYQFPEKYTADQVAEKVRLMKRTWRDVQNGKRKTTWEFTDMMSFVFEKPIDDTEEGPAQCSYQSYLNGMPTDGAQSSFRENGSSPENSPDPEKGSGTKSGETLSLCCVEDLEDLSHSSVRAMSSHENSPAAGQSSETKSEETLSILFEDELSFPVSVTENSHVDGIEFISLSDTEETPCNTIVRTEVLGHSEFSSDFNDIAEISALRANDDLFCSNDGNRDIDDVEVIIISDTEITPCRTEVKRELFHENGLNSNNFADGISTIAGDNLEDGFLVNQVLEREKDENIAAKKPNKLTGPCRITPKGRSPIKSSKGKENVENRSNTLQATAHHDNEPRTPGKKKSKTNVGSVVVPPSPAKTHKRKAVQKNLVWPTNIVEEFVAECVKKKEYVQQFPNVPLKITWDLCRAKFDHMNNLFVNTALKHGGMIGSTKWSHYDNFLKIHDIPLDVDVSGVDVSLNLEMNMDQNNNVAGGRQLLWTPRNITLLLDCYKIMKDKFNGTKSCVRHIILYAHIATIMNEFEGVQVTGKQCETQMKAMRTQFFQEHDGSRGTGCAPSKWPYFQAMKEMFHGDANVDAPFVASVGDGTLSYTARGK